MSIASELNNLEGNIEDSYDAVNDMGGIVPAQRNMDNLDQAIRTIPQSTGPTPGDGTLTIQKNGTTIATFTANQSTDTTANISVQENSTMFYGKADTLPGEAGLVIYNNATRTTQTTWQQFADALQAGPVSITFDGDVLDHPYPTAVIHSEVYGGSISFIVESAGASYTYTWDDTDTEPGTPTTKRYQPLLTAGSNISISGNTISATVPTVNDATLTIQHNGTNVQTFTANQSTNATANIETIWADDIAPATQVPPITSSMIDWSTMEHWSITLSGNKTVSQTTAYNYVDIPDASVTFTATVGGVYLVLLNASITCASASTDCYAKALLNGGNLAVGIGQNPASNKFISVSSAQVFTATQASNTIKMQLGGGTANANYTILGSVQSSVQIIRIA